MLGSCCSNEPWTFAATRAFYSDFSFTEPNQSIEVSGDSSRRNAGPEVFLIVGIMLLPIAFDLVALPVALTRDWIVLD